MDFSFGLQAVLQEPNELIEAARRAEDLGYSEFFTADHIGSSDPFIPLVVAAHATESIRVGPLVLNNEFHNPALLARTASTVDRMTGGRLVLGMGTGYAQAEHDAIGMELRSRRPRVDRFEESLAALRELLDRGSCTMSGEHIQLAVEDLGVRPVQSKTPILVGGFGKRVVSSAARHADIFQFTGMTHDDQGNLSPSGFRMADSRRRSEWLTAASGDRAEALVRSTLVQGTSVGPLESDDLRRIRTRDWYSDELAEESPFLLVGSVQQIVEKMHWLNEELGISHAVVRDAVGFAPVVAALS